LQIFVVVAARWYYDKFTFFGLNSKYIYLFSSAVVLYMLISTKSVNLSEEIDKYTTMFLNFLYMNEHLNKNSFLGEKSGVLALLTSKLYS